MAKFFLTEEEFTHMTALKNELIEKSKTASPRAAATYRTIATSLSAALAREAGNRTQRQEQEASQQTLTAIRIEKQKARLLKMQEKLTEATKPQQPAPANSKKGQS
jgi:hypothetical protein